MDAPATKPGPHYEALLQLLRTSESIWNASRVFFGRWDLSPSQFNILNVLLGSPDGSPRSNSAASSSCTGPTSPA